LIEGESTRAPLLLINVLEGPLLTTLTIHARAHARARLQLAGLPGGNPLAGNPPIESICEKFSEFLTNTLGTKRICQRTKRWWTPEVNEAHVLMGKARASIRNRQISAQEFRVAQKTWFRMLKYYCVRTLRHDFVTHTKQCASTVRFTVLFLSVIFLTNVIITCAQAHDFQDISY
jgi:hypothetical protein